MNTYSQSQGPISGHMDIELFNKDGELGSIITKEEPLTLKLTLQLDDALNAARPGKFTVVFIYEQVITPNFHQQSVEKSWEIGKKFFEFEVSVPIKDLEVGVYKIAALCTGISEEKYLFTGLAEGTLLNIIY